MKYILTVEVEVDLDECKNHDIHKEPRFTIVKDDQYDELHIRAHHDDLDEEKYDDDAYQIHTLKNPEIISIITGITVGKCKV